MHTVKLAKDAADTNQVLCEFIQWLQPTGSKIPVGRRTVLAVQTIHRDLRRRLGIVWDCIHSWQLDVPLRSRDPMQEHLVRAFVSYSIARALQYAKDLNVLTWFYLNVLVRFGFDCLLRPAKLLKVVVADTCLPRSKYEPPAAVN